MEQNASEEEALVQRVLASVDEDTAEWAQKKTRELFHLQTHYKCAMMEIETRFNLLGEEYALEHGRMPINSIKTRVKTLQSIKEKLERRNLAMTPESIRENLNDIAGVRVICAYPEDVYTLADALLRQDDITLLRKKDYIEHPKPSGYRSLHLIVTVPIYLSREKRQVKVEVQLRTIAMDFWASLEHQIRYKSNATFTEEVAQELFQCAQLSADLDKRMDRLRQSVRDGGTADGLPEEIVRDQAAPVSRLENRKRCYP
jgi:putative GTP pyrophosphokinase